MGLGPLALMGLMKGGHGPEKEGSLRRSVRVHPVGEGGEIVRTRFDGPGGMIAGEGGFQMDYVTHHVEHLRLREE